MDIFKRKKGKVEEVTKKAIEEDMKYSLVINCPSCDGNGSCVVVEELWKNTGESASIPLKYSWRNELIQRDANGDWRKWRIDTDIIQLYCREAGCPDCGGQGIAYAYFDTVPEGINTCKKCNGLGKIKRNVKVEIGIESKEFQCGECNGTGKISTPSKNIVLVKYLGHPDKKITPTEFLRDDPKYKELFSKYKPRTS